MDDSNVQSFDPSFFGDATPTAAAPTADTPGAQDRSTPLDSSMADLADQATKRLHAGEDPDAVQADLGRQMQKAQDRIAGKGKHDVTQGGVSDKNVASFDPSFFGMAPAPVSELTSQYQPLESYQGQVYNSPSAALAQPDAFAETGSQVQGVGDYLANLGTESAEKLRSAAAGVVQGVGEIPQMARDLAAKVGTFSGGVQGGVPPSAVFTAAAQAQGAPADNALASAGQFEAQKAAKAQEQAAARLVPAPDENTSGLDQAAYYTQQAVAGAPLVAGAMAAGPAGGAALFGASTAGEQYATKRGAGEAPVSAAASSGIEGAVSALTASLSLESALNPGAIGALRRIAETTGSVEAQSVINEATSIAAEQSIDGKAISADEIQARLIGAAKGGIPAGVLMGGIGAATHGGDAAETAAANVRRLAENIAPTEAQPTLEERVNAREIPQDQGGVPGQGIVEEGGREGSGADLQQPAETGAGAGNAEGAVNRGAENVDKNVQPTDAERAAQTAAQAEVPQDAQAEEVTPDATASVAPPPEVPRNEDTAGAEDAVAAGEEGVRTAQVETPLYSRDEQTKTPEFKNWFGKSKVLDGDEPAVVYHGTVGNRGTFDLGNPDITYARREASPTTDNLTHEQAREALTKEFGATAMRKLEAHGLNLVPRANLSEHAPELSPAQRAGVKGFTPPDRSSANVVHDNVTRAELPETVIHEVGHANLDRILPEATRNALASAIQARGRTSPEVRAALDAIPKTTPKASMREEVLAQTMGSLYTQPIGRRVVDAFKLGLNRMGVPMDWLGAHEAAIRKIGIENLRHYAEAPRRSPVTTVQMRAPAAPVSAGQAPGQMPRIRVPVDQAPVERVPERPARSETPVASESAVGTKNAAQAAKRAERDLDPIVTAMRPNDKQVWDAAAQRRADDPTAGYRLAAEMAKDEPRRISRENEALLIQHTAELHNRYDDVLSRIEAAQKTGDTNAAVNAQMERMSIEGDLATNEKATREIGRDWSDIGRMRQKLAERDFSMARQVMRFKALTGDLPQRLRDQIAQHVKTIQEGEKQLAAAQAENQALREQAPARRRTPAERKSLDDEFSTLATRAAQLRKTAAGGSRYARVEDPELAQVIRRMARNRSDAGETDPKAILEAIHQASGVPHQDIADTITSNQPYRKQTQSELQKRYNDLKRSLRDPAVQRDAARAKALQSQLADIKSRIQRKDFSPPNKRDKPVYGEAVQRLQLDVAKAKNELNAMAARQERLNDTVLGKTLRTIVDAKIFNILASVGVYKKLAGAVVTRNAGQISEEALGTVLAKLPGLRKYAAYSPRYGGRGFWAGMGEFGKGLGSAFARAKEDLQSNQNKWDVLYGNKRISQEFTDFSGRLGQAVRTPGALNKAMETTHAAARFIGGTHAAMKEFVSEPEMNVAQLQIGRYTREQMLKKGMTPDQVEEYMSRESTTASIQAQAYEHALESKFQGRNFITDNINALLSRMERSGGGVGKIGAFLAKEEFPVRGIPMNIAKELLTSYPFGALKAMSKMMKFEGLKESEKPAAADYIMKNLRKQGIGAITIALGGYLQSQLGGVPSAEKQKPTAVKPGEGSFGGQNYGTEIMHGPLPELLELGASLQRVYQKEYGSKGFPAMLESLAQVYPTLALQSIPYTDQPRRQAKTVENAQKYDHRAGYDKLLGEMILSNVVPAGVQQYARGSWPFTGLPGTDPYQGFRNARNIKEDVKLGIPGLREEVPQSR